MGGCPLGGHGWGASDDAELIAAVVEAYDRGVRCFDTADVYGLGHSERLLSRALGRRVSDVLLATKFGVRWNADGKITKDTSPTYLRAALEASLTRLQVETIDLYYVHWPDGTTPIEEVMGELHRCREEGKIRWIGLSNHDGAEVRRAVAAGPVHALQVQYSLTDRAPAEALAPVALELGIPMVTWGSLGQGLLTGKFDSNTRFADDDRRSRYEGFQGDRFLANLAIADRVRSVAARHGMTMAEVSLRWVLQRPGVQTVLFGAKRPSQVTDNVRAAEDTPLPEADMAFLSSPPPAADPAAPPA